jgi:hypothetical protein
MVGLPLGVLMGYKFTLTDKPEGFRDLYWCFNLQEPVILEYKDAVVFCSNCACTGGAEGKKPDDGFMRSHEFIGHIRKDLK